MRRLLFTATFCTLLISSSNVRADHHKLITKVKNNKAMVTTFFEKILSEPEELKAICHKDFTFTYMGKIPKNILFSNTARLITPTTFFHLGLLTSAKFSQME
jgi:hypothetical protein